MKDFLKFMLASMLGFVIILTLSFFILIGIFASIASMADKKSVSIESSTVLQIKLENEVFDRAPKDPMTFFSPAGFTMEQEPGLDEILKNIKKAQTDDKIKGIFLDLSVVPSGLATVREIRNALIEFKSGGKFIIAYGEVYSQMAYYLGSVADKMYLHPAGAIDFRGFGAQVFFLKGTLEKLDIEMQVIRHGKYKSAVEIFTEDKMSEASREQMNAMVTDFWATALADISASRNISLARLNEIADNLDAYEAGKALNIGMIDGLYYRDQLLDELRNKLGLGEKEKVRTVSLAKYTLVTPATPQKVSANKIAVVYALGNIIDGKGDDRTVGSVNISEAIRKARENDKVKAIVLRVNSPGGSASASEVIRREVVLAAKEKPVVVSMGDVAASGGYWISASASYVMADPATLTGSIGVFGMIPNMQGLFNNKLGITFDEVNTNKYSDFPNVSRPMSDYEILVIERQIEKIYDDFLSLVAEGRKMEKSQVDEIGQGRVWSGSDAKEIGLIDEFGGLTAAIDKAAGLAGITEYNLMSLPAQKEPLQQIIDELTGNVAAGRIEKELGEYYTYYDYIKQIKEASGIQARLPFEVKIK
ncbi:MAG TPA: signal peptide peptidase SppA [Bacteroidales bacterium]|nr:signal peptide peptidase SppA [Bacteroidales bacterium]HOX76682.1 signal peptide peptidase SppA [Bacteroidales bacterium]HPI86887.1 signal peptide peptidase SppA [Bacteroidales bacterium]HPM92222.1 signal peptide peptidase SppA [Bacteroidales bacterium]